MNQQMLIIVGVSLSAALGLATGYALGRDRAVIDLRMHCENHSMSQWTDSMRMFQALAFTRHAASNASHELDDGLSTTGLSNEVVQKPLLLTR